MNWKKTSLLTSATILVLATGTVYLFDIFISVPSDDIAFAPGEEQAQAMSKDEGQKPKNIIIFIADGMGFAHLSLSLLTERSENIPSVWQDFDVRGWHDARSAYGPLTDSEASATAMATGTSTNFGHIGIDKEGNRLQNVFELASANGFVTGIVTDSYIWDGTPAAFVAHTRNEDDARDILTQIAASELDLIFGELEDLGEGDVPERDGSLQILAKRFELLDASLKLPPDGLSKPIAAVFDEDEVQDLSSTPNLTQMVEVALGYMSAQSEPFVLLVESEEMDAASHENDSERVVKGLKSIQQTLASVLEFTKADQETLVVFTADHETGGMAVVADFDNYPNMQIRWSTKDHSAAVVPLYAKGPGAAVFADVSRNWQIGQKLKELFIADTSESGDD